MAIDHPRDEAFEGRFSPDIPVRERDLNLDRHIGNISMALQKEGVGDGGSSTLYERPPVGGVSLEDDLSSADVLLAEETVTPLARTETETPQATEPQTAAVEAVEATEPPIAPGMVRIVKVPEKLDTQGNSEKDDTVAPEPGNMRTAALLGETQRMVLGRQGGRVFQDISPSLVSGQIQVREANSEAGQSEVSQAEVPESQADPVQAYPYSVRMDVTFNAQASHIRSENYKGPNLADDPIGTPAGVDADKILEATGTTDFALDFKHGGIPPQQLEGKLFWAQQRLNELKGTPGLDAVKEARELKIWVDTLTSAMDVGIGRQTLTVHAASPEDLKQVVHAVEGVLGPDVEMYKAERNPDGTLRYQSGQDVDVPAAESGIARPEKPWTPDPTLRTADQFGGAVRYVSERQPGIGVEREYNLDIASNYDLRAFRRGITPVKVAESLHKGEPVGDVEVGYKAGHFIFAGGTIRGKSYLQDMVGAKLMLTNRQLQEQARREGLPVPSNLKLITINPLIEGDHERSAAYLNGLGLDVGVTVVHPDYLKLPFGDPRFDIGDLEAELIADAVIAGVLELSHDPEVNRVLVTYGPPGAKGAILKAGGFATSLEDVEQGIVDFIQGGDFEQKVKGNLTQFVGQYFKRVGNSPFFNRHGTGLDAVAMLNDPSWTRADMASVKDPIVKTVGYMGFLGKVIQAQEWRKANGMDGPVYIMGDEFRDMLNGDSYAGRKLAGLLPILRHMDIYLGVSFQTGWDKVSEHLKGNVHGGMFILGAQDPDDRRTLAAMAGNTTEHDMGYIVGKPPGHGLFWDQQMDRVGAFRSYDDATMRGEGGVIIPADQAPFADWGHIPEHLRGRIDPNKFKSADETLYKKTLGARTIAFDEVNAAAILTGHGPQDLSEKLLDPLQAMDPVERGIMVARDVTDSWYSRHELVRQVAHSTLKQQGVPFSKDDLAGHTNALMSEIIDTTIQDVLAQVEGGERPPQEVFARFALPIGHYTPLIAELDNAINAPPLVELDAQRYNALVGELKGLAIALDQQRALEKERTLWIRQVKDAVTAAFKGDVPEDAGKDAVAALHKLTGGVPRDAAIEALRGEIWEAQPEPDKTPEIQELYDRAFNTVSATFIDAYPGEKPDSPFGYYPMMQALQERIRTWKNAAPIDLSKFAATHGKRDENGQLVDAFPPEQFKFAQDQRKAVSAAEQEYLRGFGPDLVEALEREIDIYHAPDRKHGGLRLANAGSRLVEASPKRSKGYAMEAINREMLGGKSQKNFSLPKLFGHNDTDLIIEFAETLNDRFNTDIANMNPSTRIAMQGKYDKFKAAMAANAAALREEQARDAKQKRESLGANAGEEA